VATSGKRFASVTADIACATCHKNFQGNASVNKSTASNKLDITASLNSNKRICFKIAEPTFLAPA
jgi:hypothetical protein